MLEPSISIVGTGYVGLCIAVGLASKGYDVLVYDCDQKKVELVNKGTSPFHEPGLEKLLVKAVNEDHLKGVREIEEAILNTQVTFITVGTPSESSGSIDLQYINSSTREIGETLKKKKVYHLIVVKSTVVPGTTEKIVKPNIENASDKRCGADFGLCMNPEFLQEGSAIYDALNPDRIVIGEYDEKSGDILEDLYKNFYQEETPQIIRTNLPTAEIIKYANNAFLATKISFINTVANLCQKIGNTDVTVMAKAIGMDKRINPHFLNAGLGYGGSCFSKDIKALIALGQALDYDPMFFKAVEYVNHAQPKQAVELAKKNIGSLQNKRIAVLGLAFKPNTDDMRGARSIPIINHLLNEGAKIIAYDPAAVPKAKSIFGEKISYASSTIQCLKDADCCIIVTEWGEFQKLKPEDFSQNMKHPILIDGRRIYSPQEFSQKLEFIAIGLGKPNLQLT